MNLDLDTKLESIPDISLGEYVDRIAPSALLPPLDADARRAALALFGELPRLLTTGAHLAFDLHPFALGECALAAASGLASTLHDSMPLDGAAPPHFLDLRPLGLSTKLLPLVPRKHRKRVVLSALDRVEAGDLDRIARTVRSAPRARRPLAERVLALLGEAIDPPGTATDQALSLARAELAALGCPPSRLLVRRRLHAELAPLDLLTDPAVHAAASSALATEPETARYVRDPQTGHMGQTHLYRGVCECGVLVDLTLVGGTLEGTCSASSCGRRLLVRSDEVAGALRDGGLIPTTPVYYHDVALRPGLRVSGGWRFRSYMPPIVRAWTRFYELLGRSTEAELLQQREPPPLSTLLLFFLSNGQALGGLAAAALGPVEDIQRTILDCSFRQVYATSVEMRRRIAKGVELTTDPPQPIIVLS